MNQPIDYTEAYESLSPALAKFVNVPAIIQKSAEARLTPSQVIQMQTEIINFIDAVTDILK